MDDAATDRVHVTDSRIICASTVASFLQNYFKKMENEPIVQNAGGFHSKKIYFFHIKQRHLNPKPIFLRRKQFTEDCIAELTMLHTPSEMERQKILFFEMFQQMPTFVAFEKNAIYFENAEEFEKTPTEVQEEKMEQKFKKAYAQTFIAFNQFQHLNFCKKLTGQRDKRPSEEPDPVEEHADMTKSIRQEESERGMFYSKKLFYTPRFQTQRRQQWREMATGLEEKHKELVETQEKKKETEPQNKEMFQEAPKPVLEEIGIYTYRNVINPANSNQVKFRSQNLKDKLKKLVENYEQKKKADIEPEQS